MAVATGKITRGKADGMGDLRNRREPAVLDQIVGGLQAAFEEQGRGAFAGQREHTASELPLTKAKLPGKGRHIELLGG